MGEGLAVVRRLRAAGDEIACTGRAARAGAGSYRAPFWQAALRARRARRRGFGWEEMTALGLLDPALGALPARDLVGGEELRRARERVNPRQMTALTRDRAVLYRLMHAAGLPGPALYGIIGATTGWSSDGRIVAGADAFAEFIAREVPPDFVVVPCLRGHAPLVVRRTDGTLTAADGVNMTPAALLGAATGSPACDLAIVRERLTPHSDFGPQDGSGPWSVRMVTLLRADCSVDVIAAFVDMPAPEPGARGSASRSVADVASDGRVGPVLSWPPSGDRTGGSDEATLRVPQWDEALELVRRAAPLMSPLRTIAWEVVPTPRGPILQDADADYPPWPSPSCRRVADTLASTA